MIVIDGSVHAPKHPMNNRIPMIAWTSMRARTMPEMFKTAGRVAARVSITTFIPGLRDSRRRGRSTRRMRSARRKESEGNTEAKSDIKEAPTIKRSITFHELEKYGPKVCAKILSAHSAVNATVRYRLIRSRPCFRSP